MHFFGTLAIQVALMYVVENIYDFLLRSNSIYIILLCIHRFWHAKENKLKYIIQYKINAVVCACGYLARKTI